jgi:DNA-binding NarL/FixJ family response regulator
MAAVYPHFPYVCPQPAEVLRLLLTDDHPVVRAGVRELLRLEADFSVVGETDSPRTAVDLAQRLAPDVIVTDLGLGGAASAGMQFIAELRRLQPASKILVLTVHKEEEYVRGALSAGALGYVLKDACRADLVQAIRTVHAGNYYMCSPVCDSVVARFLEANTGSTTPIFPDQADPASFALTAREREVITLVAQGRSNKAVARHLGLSVKTVAKHRSNFMTKLNLHNIASLTIFAMRHGLVSPHAEAR